MKAVFLRLIEQMNKERALLESIQSRSASRSRFRFEVDLARFESLPGSAFAYWLSPRVSRLFSTFMQFEDSAHHRETKCGLGTLDDFRFLRLNWEVQNDPGRGWRAYYSGGSFSPFYEDFWLLALWRDSGKEIKTYVETKVGSASRKVQAEGYYFLPGFVFPRRTRSFSPKVMPSGGIFSTAGQAGFLLRDEILPAIAVLSSTPCSSLFKIMQGTTSQDEGGTNPQFEVGQVKRLPWPDLGPSIRGPLGDLARRAWSLKRSLDTRMENSHALTLPALLQAQGDTLAERAAGWNGRVRAVEVELAAIRAEIDERCFELYGIGEADRRAIIEGFGTLSVVADGTAASEVDDEGDDADDGGEVEASADTATLAAELVSWAVSTAFGRFDVRLATGERPIPPEPEPFDPLPVCSPGMLTGSDGLPLTTAPDGYPLALPSDGILADDPGHPRDLAAVARAVFAVVFGANGEARWDEAAALLDPRARDLRAWLARGFFELHVRRYSKSRRKAPIYWQLSTPSASYSVWLYIHRATSDTMFTALNEYVGPKLEHEERRLESLLREASSAPTAGQRKQLADQEAFVEELRTFHAEVRRVARLWDPDLNDGVIINFAPLWRLVPQHRAWQKEVKACWDSLVAGKYDWSHLAMRLWPERVVPKCAEDRSLAIAHDLEEDFWVEGDDGKWQKRPADPARIARLVEQRTAPAVKAALADLLSAPVLTAGRSGGRRARAVR